MTSAIVSTLLAVLYFLMAVRAYLWMRHDITQLTGYWYTEDRVVAWLMAIIWPLGWPVVWHASRKYGHRGNK